MVDIDKTYYMVHMHHESGSTCTTDSHIPPLHAKVGKKYTVDCHTAAVLVVVFKTELLELCEYYGVKINC